MTPGPETSMEYHCLRETWFHLSPVSLGGRDSTALLWDIPTAFPQALLIEGFPLGASHGHSQPKKMSKMSEKTPQDSHHHSKVLSHPGTSRTLL